MSLAFDLGAQPSLPIVGSEARFPIGRIFCVGQNYAAHAREMGSDPDRQPPFFFTKFPETYVPTGSEIEFPRETDDFHHEIELLVALSGGGSNVAEADANAHIFGYASSLDMTRRDLQADAKAGRRPWDTSKNFKHAAPIAPLHPVSQTGVLETGAIWLDVNGERRQDGDIADLIWPVPSIIAFLSKFYDLKAGDVILTGTPAGVGPVQPGDKLTGAIADLTPVSVTIGPRAG